MRLHQALKHPDLRVGASPIWSPNRIHDPEYRQQAAGLAQEAAESAACDADAVSEYILAGDRKRRYQNEEFAPFYSPLPQAGNVFIEAARPSRVHHVLALPNEEKLYAPRFGWLVLFQPVAALRANPNHPGAREHLAAMRHTFPDFDKYYANPKFEWITTYHLLGLYAVENGTPAVSGLLAYQICLADGEGKLLRDIKLIIEGTPGDKGLMNAQQATLIVQNCALVGMAGLWLWHQQKEAVAAGKPLDITPLKELTEKEPYVSVN